jgi:peptide/nickel transport system ATP-binding protein/oligopeptide transport system ATP-binding protein
MLKAENIRKTFPGGIHALKGVSVEIPSGETTGLIGESGCGKSTLAHIICMLERSDNGSMTLDGKEYTHKSRGMRDRIQIIFQDSAGSLDPRQTIYAALKEPLDNLTSANAGEKRVKINALLADVGLDPIHLNKYPHQLSGGERQRIVIARALAVSPNYVICDEPVSSLDADIAKQVVDLLAMLQRKHGLGYLFISHDISLAMHICKTVYVMLAGELVDVFHPDDYDRKVLHPYTQMLLSFTGREGD